jgi:hypothetical protein
MPRVVDNTVLTNFSLVDRLDILRRLFGKVHVTYEVREEVLRGLGEGYRFMSRAEAEIGLAQGPGWNWWGLIPRRKSRAFVSLRRD